MVFKLLLVFEFFSSDERDGDICFVISVKGVEIASDIDGRRCLLIVGNGKSLCITRLTRARCRVKG